MDQNTINLLVGVATIITAVLGIIVSNHKLKNQLVDDVKTPIKEMQKEVAEMKSNVTNLKNQVNDMQGAMTKNDKLTNNALLSILRHRLTESGHRYIKLGYIVEDELEAFINEYESYSTLGGNHYVTALYKKIMELPVRSIEENEKKTTKKRIKQTINEETTITA